MKVIIIKEKPNIHLTKFIKTVKDNYDGIVISTNQYSKTDELIDILRNNKKSKLLPELEKLNQSLNKVMFEDLINTLDQKKEKELIFIYINDEENIKILEKKYKTLTVEKDFIFDIIECNTMTDKAIKLISKLV